MNEILNCLNCNKGFKLSSYNSESRIYCSKNCYNKSYHKKYRLEHLQDFKDYYLNNKQRLNQKWKAEQESYKQEINTLLGNVCKRCGFSDKRILQIDHINGDGVKDREVNGFHHYKKRLQMIKTNPNKYQLLCPNCNWLKRIEKNC